MRIDDGMDIRPFAVDGRVQKHFFRRFEFSVQRAPRFVDLDDVLGRHFVEPLMQMPKDENPFRLGIPGTDMAEVSNNSSRTQIRTLSASRCFSSLIRSESLPVFMRDPFFRCPLLVSLAALQAFSEISSRRRRGRGVNFFREILRTLRTLRSCVNTSFTRMEATSAYAQVATAPCLLPFGASPQDQEFTLTIQPRLHKHRQV